MHKPLYKPLFEQAICKQCPPPWEAARGCWTSFRGRRQGGRVLDRAAGAEPHGLAKQGGPQQGGRTSSCFPCAPGRGLRAGRQREAPAARLADRVAFIQHRFALRAADFRFRQLRPALPAVHARVAHGRPFPFPSKAASSDRACVGHVSTQCAGRQRRHTLAENRGTASAPGSRGAGSRRRTCMQRRRRCGDSDRWGVRHLRRRTGCICSRAGDDCLRASVASRLYEATAGGRAGGDAVPLLAGDHARAAADAAGGVEGISAPAAPARARPPRLLRPRDLRPRSRPRPASRRPRPSPARACARASVSPWRNETRRTVRDRCRTERRTRCRRPSSRNREAPGRRMPATNPSAP